MSKKPLDTNVDRILRELGLPPEAVPYTQAMRARDTAPIARPKGPCGKTCYPSKVGAKKGARALLNTGRANTSFLRAYLCARCSAWHISSHKYKRRGA